jgi:hypothetical protein
VTEDIDVSLKALSPITEHKSKKKKKKNTHTHFEIFKKCIFFIDLFWLLLWICISEMICRA